MIEFRGVWFKYDEEGEYVLKDINLTVKRGEIISILGDNGSGKTTLIKHMNGLLKPTKGDVYVDGVNTKEKPISELSRKVAIVFQYPEKMFFSPSVEEELKATLKNFGVEGEELESRVEEILEEFRLADLRDRTPFSLSGGEQRRLSIAIAFSWDPDYIILDEPTTGLDGESRRDLTKTIENVLSKGKTVIIVTHDLEYLFEFAPKIILLNQGTIVFQGRFRELLENNEIVIRNGLDTPKISMLIKFLGSDGGFPEIRYSDLLSMIVGKLGCRGDV